MNEEVIARMRDRIRRVQRVIDLAHDPEMIAMLEEMVAEAEADIKKLEAGATPPAEADRADRLKPDNDQQAPDG